MTDVLNRITSDPRIFGGKPIIRGMRVSVEMILSLLAQGEDWDSLDMESLINQLADFLLQSGFASEYYRFSEMDGERTMEQLREAILEALRSLNIEYVISSPGSEWPSFWEALARQRQSCTPGPTYLDCGHETLAVAIATGYTARTVGRFNCHRALRSWRP